MNTEKLDELIKWEIGGYTKKEYVKRYLPSLFEIINDTKKDQEIAKLENWYERTREQQIWLADFASEINQILKQNGKKKTLGVEATARIAELLANLQAEF